MPKNVALALALSASPPRHEGALVPHGGVSDAFTGVHTEQTMDITGGGGGSDAPTTSDSEGGYPDEWPMSPLGSTPYCRQINKMLLFACDSGQRVGVYRRQKQHFIYLSTC